MVAYSFQQWTGKYFAKTTLKALGLCVQLGHAGDPCPNKGRRNSKMIVGDLTGFHEISIRFCLCCKEDNTIPYTWQQLLQVGWFPATQKYPTTVFTFQLLYFLHQLNLQAKTSLYDFHKSLWWVTDNSQLLSIV